MASKIVFQVIFLESSRLICLEDEFIDSYSENLIEAWQNISFSDLRHRIQCNSNDTEFGQSMSICFQFIYLFFKIVFPLGVSINIVIRVHGSLNRFPVATSKTD